MSNLCVEFLYEKIGRHVAPDMKGQGDFLRKNIPHRTKKMPEGDPRRLGPAGCVLLASNEDSIVLAPLVGVRPVNGFKVIDPVFLPENEGKGVVIGRWLWKVKAPFVYAEQTKSPVGDNLRLSMSVRGGKFCTPNGVYAFDLSMCRDLAAKVLEAGASKKYVSYLSDQQRYGDLDPRDSGTANLQASLGVRLSGVETKYPALKGLRFPRIGSVEFDVLKLLVQAAEVDHGN